MHNQEPRVRMQGAESQPESAPMAANALLGQHNALAISQGPDPPPNTGSLGTPKRVMVNNTELEITTIIVGGEEYMLQRMAEHMLCPGSKNNGAFLKLMNKHLPSVACNGKRSITLSKRTHTGDGVTTAEFELMSTAMIHFQRAMEPLARAPSVFSVVQTELVVKLAKESCKHSLGLRISMLHVLGSEIPECMHLEQESQHNDQNGYLDFELEDRRDALAAVLGPTEDGAAEAVEIAGTGLLDELAVYEPFAEDTQDNSKLKEYSLKPVRHLLVQLQSFMSFRTQKLQCFRQGKPVSKVTATTDVQNFLRFLGWRAFAHPPPVRCLSECLAVVPPESQEFSVFLVRERQVGYGTVANYINSVLNVMQYIEVEAENLDAIRAGRDTSAEDTTAMAVAVVDGNSLHKLFECLGNVRAQAEAEATQAKLYKPRKAGWISWIEAKQTRHAALSALDSLPKSTPRSKRLEVHTDALIICFFTIMPPDRCSVIRLLSVALEGASAQEKSNVTLKPCVGSDGFYIDLTKFKHKTSKYYGPSMTPVSHLITPLLKSFLLLTQSRFEFSEFGDDEAQARTRQRSLFAMPTDATRCFESSNWTQRVKQAFSRYHAEKKAPCPTLLRSSFITALRDSNPDVSTLQSAAVAQKHSMSMQASDAYDLEAHVRGTQKAMDWCHEFAEGHAAIGAAAPKQAIVVKAVAPEQPVSNGLDDEPTQKKPCRRPVGHWGAKMNTTSYRG